MTDSDKVYGCGCPACVKFHTTDDKYLFDMADIVSPPVHLSMIKKSFNEWYKNCPVMASKRSKYVPKSNGSPKGCFAGTLTMSPSDCFNEEDMISSVKKIFSQKTCPVEKYAWYLEYTENGLPHIHFIYKAKSGGRIHQKVFKRCWSIWDESQPVGSGHRGGYHRLCHDEGDYLKYIKKDNGRHQSNWTQD